MGLLYIIIMYDMINYIMLIFPIYRFLIYFMIKLLNVDCLYIFIRFFMVDRFLRFVIEDSLCIYYYKIIIFIEFKI